MTREARTPKAQAECLEREAEGRGIPRENCQDCWERASPGTRDKILGHAKALSKKGGGHCKGPGGGLRKGLEQSSRAAGNGPSTRRGSAGWQTGGRKRDSVDVPG